MTNLGRNFQNIFPSLAIGCIYSVNEIDNSEKILANITAEIRNKFEPLFFQTDSVMIFILSKTCEIIRMGYAKNEESEFIII